MARFNNDLKNSITFPTPFMSYLEPKEQFLLDLLRNNPEMSMKEANAIIRDKYDTGVSPPVYSKVKKILTGAGESSKKIEVLETKVIPVAEVAPPAPVVSNGHVPVEILAVSDTVAEDFFSIPSPASNSAIIEEDADEDDFAPEGSQGFSISDGGMDEEPAPVEPIIPKRLCPTAFKTRIKSAQTVHLAGSFNAWKKDQYPMRKGDNNWWYFEGDLPEGEHHYKYVVDQMSWYLDFTQPFVTDETGVSHKVTIA